jgi:hypothetical protein
VFIVLIIVALVLFYIIGCILAYYVLCKDWYKSFSDISEKDQNELVSLSICSWVVFIIFLGIDFLSILGGLVTKILKPILSKIENKAKKRIKK